MPGKVERWYRICQERDRTYTIRMATRLGGDYKEIVGWAKTKSAAKQKLAALERQELKRLLCGCRGWD